MKLRILIGLACSATILAAQEPAGTNATVEATRALPAKVAYDSEKPAPAKTNAIPTVSFNFDSQTTRATEASRYGLADTSFTVHRGSTAVYRGAVVQISKHRKFNPLHLINPFAPAEYGNGGAVAGNGNRIFRDEKKDFPEGVVLLSVSK